MWLYVLFILNTDGYTSAEAVIDEYGYDENPLGWLKGEVERGKQAYGSEYEAHRVAKVYIDGTFVQGMFDTPVVTAEREQAVDL